MNQVPIYILSNGWMQRGANLGYLIFKIEDYYSLPAWEPHFSFRTDYDKIVNDQGIMVVHDVDWQWEEHRKGARTRFNG